MVKKKYTEISTLEKLIIPNTIQNLTEKIPLPSKKYVPNLLTLQIDRLCPIFDNIHQT